MGVIKTVLWALLAVCAIVVAVVQTRDGSLQRIFGRGSFDEGQALFSYDPHQAELIIVRMGDKSVEFTKNEQGEWWARSPWKDRVDPRAAAAIIQFSLGTKIVDTLPITNAVKGNMREFGVETAPVEVIIKDKRERSLARFKLGNQAPWLIIPEKKNEQDKPEEPIPTLYLKTDYYQWAEDIFVVTGNIAPLFKEGMRYLQDYRPLYFNVQELAQIHFILPQNDFSLMRETKASPWKIGGEMSFDSDPKMVRNLLGVLQTLSAEKILKSTDISLSDRQRDQKRELVLSFFDNSAPITFAIYPPEKNDSTHVLAQVSNRDVYFLLPINAPDKGVLGVNNLAMSAKILRSRILVPINKDDLKAVSIRSQENLDSIVVKKSIHGKWLGSIGGSNPKPVNEYQLVSFLKALLYTPVEDFATDSAVDLDPYGLASPLFTLTFSVENASPVSVVIGQGIDNKYYAQRDELDTVYALSDDYMMSLGLNPYKWKTLNLLDFNSSELKHIILHRPQRPEQRLYYDFGGESWRIEEKVGDKMVDVTPEINPHKANNYLSGLELFEVVCWLPSSNSSAQKALKKSLYQITMVIDPTIPVPGVPLLTLTVNLAPAGRMGSMPMYYGQMEGDSDYFMIDEVKLHELFPVLRENQDDDR